MFEICALLSTKKVAKVRKVRGPSCKVGAAVKVYGHKGTIAAKHPTNAGWWLVEVEGRTGTHGFDRSAIDVVS